MLSVVDHLKLIDALENHTTLCPHIGELRRAGDPVHSDGEWMGTIGLHRDTLTERPKSLDKGLGQLE